MRGVDEPYKGVVAPDKSQVAGKKRNREMVGGSKMTDTKGVPRCSCDVVLFLSGTEQECGHAAWDRTQPDEMGPRSEWVRDPE